MLPIHPRSRYENGPRACPTIIITKMKCTWAKHTRIVPFVGSSRELERYVFSRNMTEDMEFVANYIIIVVAVLNSSRAQPRRATVSLSTDDHRMMMDSVNILFPHTHDYGVSRSSTAANPAKNMTGVIWGDDNDDDNNRQHTASAMISIRACSKICSQRRLNMMHTL
jgi:hypothetical protein